MEKSRIPYLPLVLAAGIILGVLLGSRLSTDGESTGIMSVVNPKFNKLTEVMNYIERDYVDSIDREKIEDETIQRMLDDLDPHSFYITAADVKSMNEPLEGKFDGIGIEFSIKNDTVVVISPISGGPSEKLGILPGDRIIKVEGELIAGNGVTNKIVMEKLRGVSGSKVKVSILRAGQSELLKFNITRDKIPIFSVDVSYMAAEEIGYIKVSRFARKTHQEMMDAYDQLQAQGMNKLILDLRGNGGGYLNAASDIADEFLKDGELIVFTEGRNRSRRNYTATSKGRAEDMELVVLIDEGSASASEIVSGALQDNDRATIIGRRSFGKGLVQEQNPWPDGSAMRLTIARYYTPTGRCIQKPYNKGTEAYNDEYMDRMYSGELLSADSIHFNDSLKYVTPGGKVVYGGGGIMPDVFVPIDTSRNTIYMSELVYSGTLNDFAFKYADQHRDDLMTQMTLDEFLHTYEISPAIIDSLVAAGESNEVKFNPSELDQSLPIIQARLKASIGRYLWHNQAYFPALHTVDNAFHKAVEVLSH